MKHFDDCPIILDDYLNYLLTIKCLFHCPLEILSALVAIT